MRTLIRSLSWTLPVLLLLSACGSADDDPDAAANNDNAADTDNGDDDGANGSRDSSSGSGDIPRLKDGAYSRGTLHIEVSGDEEFETDLEGNGFAQGGFAVLTFGSSTATVILGFNPDSEDDPGALSVTSVDVSTAGEWGADCDIAIDESDDRVEGQFSCDDLDALGSSTDDITVDIEGAFTLER